MDNSIETQHTKFELLPVYLFILALKRPSNKILDWEHVAFWLMYCPLFLFFNYLMILVYWNVAASTFPFKRTILNDCMYMHCNEIPGQ